MLIPLLQSSHSCQSQITFMATIHPHEMLNYASKLRITDSSEKAPVPLLLAHCLPSIQPHYELNPLRKGSCTHHRPLPPTRLSPFNPSSTEYSDTSSTGYESQVCSAPLSLFVKADVDDWKDFWTSRRRSFHGFGAVMRKEDGHSRGPGSRRSPCYWEVPEATISTYPVPLEAPRHHGSVESTFNFVFPSTTFSEWALNIEPSNDR